LTYEPFGSLKTANYGNTLKLTQDWGNEARLASKRVYRANNSNVSMLSYGYDASDNMVSITDGVDATRSTGFGYDAVERLTRIDGNLSGGMKREDHVHDANGNRVRVERRALASDVTPANTDTYTTTAGTNRLASITSAAGTRAISYDARGNTLSETRPASVSVSAAYDGYARLTSYAQGGTSLAHVYNGLDDRVATTTGGTTRRYVYDADGRILGEYGASAADVKAEYLWLSATDCGGIAITL
jgi:YD repeat-containing protein